MNTLGALATIPWYTLGPWEIGPLTIQGFGLMVAIGVMLAYQVASWRANNFGLSVDAIQSLMLHMLIAGFIGAHVFDLIMYHPGKLLSDPAILFKFGSTLSSYGGILGAIIGIFIWKWRNPLQDLLPMTDVAAFALPIGWFFGRVGCAVVHDHPGPASDFALAVEFPDGIARHDLGLYEAMWWLVVIAVFWGIAMSRKDDLFKRRPGFFLALLPIIYTPVRFSLDFMRKTDQDGGDARYLDLTPAQYLSMAAMVFGIFMMIRWTQKKTFQREIKPASTDIMDDIKAEQDKKKKKK